MYSNTEPTAPTDLESVLLRLFNNLIHDLSRWLGRSCDIIAKFLRTYLYSETNFVGHCSIYRVYI